MKPKLLCIICTLLLLTGCRATTETNAASSNQINQNTPTSKEAHLKELIANYEVKIKGLQYDFEITPGDNFKRVPLYFYMYMTEPEIIETTKKSVTATGILSDGDHSTEKAVSIQYLLQDGDIVGYSLFSDEADEEYILTPARPFFSEGLEKPLYYSLKINLHVDDFTPEKYPLIELGEGTWKDNYNYEGSLIVTDNTGKKYMIPHILLNYSTGFTYARDEWAWGTWNLCRMEELE